MEKILVTGGAGYLGAVLVPKLVRAGHFVRVLDLFLYGDKDLFSPELIKTGRLDLIRGDLRDIPLVRELLKGMTTVIHLAGISNDPSSDLDPELTRAVNIKASEHLIDAARELGIKRFINASSSSVYGIKEEPEVTETLSLEPLTVYSESKALIEDYLETHKGSMVSVSVRSATICGYSPRMRLDLTVNILTHHAIQKGKILVFGGSQKRPNIHIDDISNLYLELVTAESEQIDGEKFNACGANHTVQALADLVQKTVAPQCPIEVVPTNDLRSYHISAEHLKKKLGFSPKKTIADAIKDVATAFKENRFPDPDSDRYYNVRVMKKVLQPESLR